MNLTFDKSRIIRVLQREHMGKHSCDPQGIVDIINQNVGSREAEGDLQEMIDAGFSEEHIIRSLNYDISRLVDMHKYAEGIRGKNILEIGCGANVGCTEGSNYQARELSSLGGNVVGLDIDSSPNENYRHIQVDLLRTPIRAVLPSGFKPDIAIAKMFFDSPKLARRLRKGINPSFVEDICGEVYEMLPQGGIFFTQAESIESLSSFSKNQRDVPNEGERILEKLGFKNIGEMESACLEAYRKM